MIDQATSNHHPRVGIIGGGQLARMTAEAAQSIGVDVVVLEREGGSPAGQIVGSANEIVGDWRDLDSRERLAARVDLVTLENEFVDADALAWFVERGRPVRPNPETLRIVQDKLRQKEALATAGLAVPRFCQVESAADVVAAGSWFGWPLVLKARRLGYDGRGNATVDGPAGVPSAIRTLAGPTKLRGSLDLYAESFVPFIREIAVMVTRRRDGSTAAYPVVETTQRSHICHEVVCPADLPVDVDRRARKIATAAVEAVGAVGVVGVELFFLADQTILVNELAPRPHNSGHYTIEGSRTSQFENHLRAVLDWPLGSTDPRAPAVAMVNLLGTTNGLAEPRGLVAAAAVPRTFLHLYGKRQVRVGRKMGHVTALGECREEALESARTAARLIEW